MTTRVEISENMVLRLRRSVRLRFDKARGIQTLLAPERVVVLNDTSVMILEALDGRSLGAIIDGFAAQFAAPRDQIAADVTAMMQDFADKGYLEIQ